jgi:hypothetical protein
MEIRDGIVILDNAERNLWQKLLGRRLPQRFPVLLLRDPASAVSGSFRKTGNRKKQCYAHSMYPHCQKGYFSDGQL